MNSMNNRQGINRTEVESPWMAGRGHQEKLTAQSRSSSFGRGGAQERKKQFKKIKIKKTDIEKVKALQTLKFNNRNSQSHKNSESWPFLSLKHNKTQHTPIHHSC